MAAVESTVKSSLARAIGVLDLIARYAPQTLGVTAIARELGLPKAVAHRIAKEFVACRFLAFDDESKQYSLGSSALTLGLAALRSLSIPAAARPYLERLSAETGETTTLSVRQGYSRLYIDQVVSPQEVRMTVALGTQHVLHAGSSSKCILATMADEEVELYLESVELASLTTATITSRSRLWDDLRAIRERGYAISMGERESAAGSVAAAIHDASGSVWGSISVCGPRERFSPEACGRFGALVVDAASAIAKDIGYRHDPS